MDAVKSILQNDIVSLEEYITYKEEKNKKLKDTLEKISKFIDEDKRVTDAARNYIKKHDYCLDPKMDEKEIDENINQVYSKLEFLNSTLDNITNKFKKMYSPQDNEYTNCSSENFNSDLDSESLAESCSSTLTVLGKIV